MCVMLIFLSWQAPIDGDYILQDFGRDALDLSKEIFEKLRSGGEEASLEVGLKAWSSWSKAGFVARIGFQIVCE